jgi:lauroyl/myristoyl acyltransferase
MRTAAALLALVRSLPLEAAVVLTRLVAVAYLLARPDYRAEIGRNYRLVTGQEPGWFWLRNAWTIGRNLALMARTGSKRAELQIDRARVYAQNQAVLLLERNLHTAMASFHFGLWEFLPGWFARAGRPVQLVVGRQRGKVLAWLLERLRRSDRVAVGGSLKTAAAARGRPGISGFMLDNTSQGGETWTEAGGLRVRMPALAFRFGSGAVQTAFARLERGRVRVDLYPAGSERVAAEALLEQVRAHPEEWVFWAKDGAVQETAE